MRSPYYILVGRVVRPVENIQEWIAGQEFESRRVAETDIGEYWVSTVFLGTDHNFSGAGPPILFESMVFGPKTGDVVDVGNGRWYEARESLCYQHRYRTYDEAEHGHEQLCREIRRLIESSEAVVAARIGRAMLDKQ
jgi:hypothetical protein